VGAFARWAATLALIAIGLMAWARLGPATRFTRASLTPGLGVRDLVFWSTLAFALTGFESASFMGEEIKDARRTIPRAIFVSLPLITLMYVLGTICVLVALPPERLSGLQGPIDAIEAAATRLGLDSLTPVAAFLITLSALGSVGHPGQHDVHLPSHPVPARFRVDDPAAARACRRRGDPRAGRAPGGGPRRSGRVRHDGGLDRAVLLPRRGRAAQDPGGRQDPR